MRLVSASVLCAILQSVPLQNAMKKILSAACGCMIALLAIAPLANIDVAAYLSQLPSWIETVPLQEVQSNEELLKELICEQTEQLIEQKAEEYDIGAEADITLKYDETVGTYLPYSVILTVRQSDGTMDGLRRYIADELSIPEERQTWRLK